MDNSRVHNLQYSSWAYYNNKMMYWGKLVREQIKLYKDYFEID